MIARRLLAGLALLLLAPPPRGADAAVEAYTVRLPRDGIVVDVPYTTGTHHEHVAEADGTVRLDPATLTLERARLVFPLAAFRSDDPQRGCHLREALGLDYDRSRFPREHVCDDRNQLPSSGPDAVAFPQIVLELTQGAPVAGGGAAGAGEVEVAGTLTVHGRSRPERLQLTVAPDPSEPGALRVRGRVPLRLADFGVVVKPAKVLFVSIAVRDEVSVVVDALLEPIRRDTGPRLP
jgi:polyisoprenoid-binding protein YceI